MAYDKILLAPSGSTGNNTHTAVDVNLSGRVFAFQLYVEAAGGTPAITYKFQGSLGGVQYYDLLYVTDSTDSASAAARTFSTPAADKAEVLFPANGLIRAYRYWRLVTSANTNVTYRGELYVPE